MSGIRGLSTIFIRRGIRSENCLKNWNKWVLFSAEEAMFWKIKFFHRKLNSTKTWRFVNIADFWIFLEVNNSWFRTLLKIKSVMIYRMIFSHLKKVEQKSDCSIQFSKIEVISYDYLFYHLTIPRKKSILITWHISL